MKIPEWADEKLSLDLPLLRSRGESQELEYKKEFPKNVSKLGKEIAAFASSNSGTIIIGVSDTGDLIGIPECNTSKERDQLLGRLEGISKGTVKPSITPTAKFAIEDDEVVLVIIVPKGSQPIYYCSDTPYIRHLTQARPAEPHEVIDRVAEFLNEMPTMVTDTQDVEKYHFYSQLLKELSDVLAIVDEAEERDVNPWLEMWRSDFGYTASELREMAASSVAIKEGLDDEFRELATSLDEVANMRLYLGSGGDLNEGVRKVEELASSMLERHFAGEPLSESSLDQVRELIHSTAIKLSDLSSRSAGMVDTGRIDELQSEASDLARPLTRMAYYKIDTLGKDVKSDLYLIARNLHLIETIRLYMDGGRSMQSVVDRVSECSEQLSKLSESVSH